MNNGSFFLWAKQEAWATNKVVITARVSIFFYKSESRDEEPEWFSGGPSSQNDTIELRGFAGVGSSGQEEDVSVEGERARDWFRKKIEVASVTEEKDEISIEGVPGGRSTPTRSKPEKSLNDQSYIFEDILVGHDPRLAGLPTNGVGATAIPNAKSRFSKWFSAETNNTSDSRRSSVQDETIIKSLPEGSERN
ncbi:hypothetical protein MTP99_006116 [Tenebrio molitor]|nr:hypothetical protein MTP99_006116 [Tenebrio molitor]